jgi:signal transduction histidine kinase
MVNLLQKIISEVSYPLPDEFADPYRTYLQKLFVVRLNFAYLCGIILIPGAFVFDRLIFPDLWLQLLQVRLISIAPCLLLLILSNATTLKNSPSLMCHVFFAVVAATIAQLISLTGAYASPYYTGLILIFIGIAIIVPQGFGGSLLSGCIILTVHFGYNLLPALLANAVVDWPAVWNSVYFLTFSFLLAVISSGISENTRRRLFVGSEREKAEGRKLKESSDKIDSLLKMKNRFFSNITHELKTPLAMLVGNSELLLEKGDHLDDAVGDQLQIMRQAAFQLSAHVDRIIALSNSNDPDVRLQTDHFDYVGVVQGTFSMFKPKATEEKIEYRLNVPSTRLVVNMDVVRIEEVLNNLVQNAFKFTRPGGVITVTVDADGTDVYTEVSDTGIGIPERHLNHVFERLYQADEGLAKRHAGMGIGLYLSKQNVELHGGTISVKSPAGRGSTFKFSLPLHADQSVPTRNSPYKGPERRMRNEGRTGLERRASDRRKKFEYQWGLGLGNPPETHLGEDLKVYENRRPGSPTVLIVEDNPGMMKVVAAALSDEYNLLLSYDGFGALNKLKAHQDQISLILSDIMMPGMSGFDFCSAVMANDRWKQIPLIFVTALLSEEEQIRGFQLGAADYIVKPYNIKILKEKIGHWIMRREYEALLIEMSRSLDLQAKNMERIKDIIIHEIHNPLQVISGAGDLLAMLSDSRSEESLEELQKMPEYMELLQQGIQSMTSVIETSKLISGEGFVPKQPETVAALFDASLAQCFHFLGNIKVDVDLAVAGQSRILCDKRMLVQVFVNLIRNAAEAIKERGRNGDGVIRVNAEVRPERHVVMAIHDNGIGMDPETKRKLFKLKFTTKRDGTGIGLSLSKMVIKLHEGSIRVESEKGGGTTFFIQLPVCNPEEPSLQTPPTRP